MENLPVGYASVISMYGAHPSNASPADAGVGMKTLTGWRYRILWKKSERMIRPDWQKIFEIFRAGERKTVAAFIPAAGLHQPSAIGCREIAQLAPLASHPGIGNSRHRKLKSS
jgi:hypothetical protein